jgi:hypothetical protein
MGRAGKVERGFRLLAPPERIGAFLQYEPNFFAASDEEWLSLCAMSSVLAIGCERISGNQRYCWCTLCQQVIVAIIEEL